SLPLFLIFYIRFLGRHSWLTTGLITVFVPIATFFFFDIALKITLPKGISIIEETVFYPLYAIFL
ncbi:MAG: tripartite tricarboxylate transporter TctB family protein, partial [Hyphomicrobiales bacterium]|nr:tripartite tricarboxylate transporter TctB family protein [Hyphomicrobiales bacterium]